MMMLLLLVVAELGTAAQGMHTEVLGIVLEAVGHRHGSRSIHLHLGLIR